MLFRSHKDGKTFSIRPEKIKFGNNNLVVASGEVASVTFLGALTRFDIKLENADLLTVLNENDGLAPQPSAGEKVQISWDSKYETQVS